MNDIFSITKGQLQDILVEAGIKKFRADQIFHYIYKENIWSWNEMVLLPKKDREILKGLLPIYIPEVADRQVSEDKETVKLLLRLQDGQTVETVLMKHDYGNSVCLSSQVGCAVNCAFCASAKNGFVRNLTIGEMTAQLMAFRKYVTSELHSVVLMGTGEPLLNYDNVLAFIRLIHEKDTFYLGYRNITLSTSGIVPVVYRLAEEGIPLNLAVSLHAPNDRIRKKIMPIAERFDFDSVVQAAQTYFEKTGRKVTFEYILIKDVNISDACAFQLAQLFSHKNVLLNLIPINDNYDVGLYRPSATESERFLTYLKRKGVNATLRREMGSNIQAACGQLRIKRNS